MTRAYSRICRPTPTHAPANPPTTLTTPFYLPTVNREHSAPRARPVESECEVASSNDEQDDVESVNAANEGTDINHADNADHAAGAHVEVTKLVDAAMKEVQRLVCQHNHPVPREHAAEFRRNLVQGTKDLMESMIDHVAQELKDDEGVFAHLQANADAAATGQRRSGRPSNQLHTGVKGGSRGQTRA